MEFSTLNFCLENKKRRMKSHQIPKMLFEYNPARKEDPERLENRWKYTYLVQ
jgi:hypothetical protein